MPLLDHVALYLIATTPPAGPNAAWFERIVAAVRGGVQAVQLRDKPGSTESRRAALAQLRELIDGRALLLVNDDLDAVWSPESGRLADGVHLGRSDALTLSRLPEPSQGDGLREARARLGHDIALGTSTRTHAEVDAAFACGVDHVGFGAMFPTTTKSNTTRADPNVLAECTRSAPGPIFPIGGIGPAEIRALGLRRAAVGGAILDVKDPSAAAAACRRALEA